MTYIRISKKYKTLTSSTSLSLPNSDITEEVYKINSTNSVTVTLASSASVGSGFTYQIKRIGSGNVTINTSSSEYIDSSSQTSFSITAQYDSITLTSEGSNWILI